MVFALVKPLLNERTISKIHIYGQDATIWKEALVVSIPADCLPVSYGGTKTDPIDGNPDCSSLVYTFWSLMYLFITLLPWYNLGQHGW